MVDMSQFVAAKSDQLNADDLMGGPRIIRIRKVTANEGSPEQPVDVYYDGDDNKPLRPCKTVRRVMVAVWGPDASQYVGKSMRIYRDPRVKFGGMEVGGIRVDQMSHIDGKIVVAVNARKGGKAAYEVLPLPADLPAIDKAAAWAADTLQAIADAPDTAALDAVMVKASGGIKKLEKARPELFAQLLDAEGAARSRYADTTFDEPAEVDFAA